MAMSLGVSFATPQFPGLFWPWRSGVDNREASQNPTHEISVSFSFFPLTKMPLQQDPNPWPEQGRFGHCGKLGSAVVACPLPQSPPNPPSLVFVLLIILSLVFYYSLFLGFFCFGFILILGPYSWAGIPVLGQAFVPVLNPSVYVCIYNLSKKYYNY